MPRRPGPEKQDKRSAAIRTSSRGLAAEAEAEAEGGDAKLENWADQPDSDAYQDAVELYEKIQRCYDNKQQQLDWCEEYWAIFNAQLDANLQYSGNSQCYVPVVRDAIRARVKRALAQLFPVNHKHIECISSTGERPYAQIALMEHYIRKMKLKNRIVKADLIAGDVTGQWCLYVDWMRSKRNIRKIVRSPKILTDHELGLQTENPLDLDERLEDEEIVEESPDVVPFAVEDLAVYPPTMNDIEKSIASCIRLRMSKDEVRRMIDEGVFVGTNADELFDQFQQPDGGREKKVPPKKRTNDAGIRTEGTYKYALVYEVATNLDLGNGKKDPVYIYFAGPQEPCGIIRNPNWHGRRPTLSASIDEIAGSFFGMSPIEPVKYMQWNIIDLWNMGQDSAQYGLLPVFMTDPLKNPQWQSMVMGLAAIWLTSPNDTKAMQFPPIYKDAMAVVDAMKRQVWESMDVNEMMMGKMPAGRKNNQLMGALQQEQNINQIDHAKRYEEMILDPLMEMIYEMDAQYRDRDLTVINMGEIGVKARLEEIPPHAWGERFVFQWAGTAYMMGMQRIQQQIGAMNVIRGIPPQQLNGRRIDVTPIIETLVENVFGPELAPRILIDERNLFTIDPEEENTMLFNNIPVDVHMGDDDAAHVKVHQAGAMQTGDQFGQFRRHIMMHMVRMQAKAQQAAGQAQQGAPGVPGGQPGPGVPGSPRPGAQPAGPRMNGAQAPAGTVHPDQMMDGAMAGRG